MPRTLTRIAIAAGALTTALSASAQDASATLHLRATAATCANCNGTNGRPVAGSALPPLPGRPTAYMPMQMQALPDRNRPATVMHQITKGLTQQQVEQVSDYFAAIKR